MTKSEIIDSIISNCNVEIISNLMSAFTTLKKKHDSDTFLEYLKKYKIPKSKIARNIALAKETAHSKNNANSQLDIEKIQMSMIGKIDKSTGYKRNPNSTQIQFLRKELYKLPEFKHLFTITTAEELYKIYFIIDFVNLQLGTDYEMFTVYSYDDSFKKAKFKTINIKMIKNMLSKCSVEDLTDLLHSLETENYGSYINEPEYDPYGSFIDDTDINTLYFVYENIDIIEKNIDILSLFFDSVMQSHSDEEIEVLNIELRKRKSVEHDDDNIRELINIRYSDNVVIDDEKDFRYHTFHNKLSEVDNSTSDRIIYIFRNMTSDKWDFIVQAFDKFAKPAGKIAIDYFNKIIQ